jgi:lysophospholipase L1-like esterase
VASILLLSLSLSLNARTEIIQDSILPDSTILQWEADIAVFDSLNLNEIISENSILFTGSSSIRRWDSLSWDMAPYLVIKRGYGGAKLSDFSHYLHRIVRAGEYRAIVIFIANDISGKVGDKTPDEVFEMFRNVAERLRNSNPDSEIFWIDVTPTPARWTAYPQVRQAGEQIREYCERTEHLHFIQTSHYILNSAQFPDKSLFVEDMLHLNRKGYFIWAGIIKQALAEAGIFP